MAYSRNPHSGHHNSLLLPGLGGAKSGVVVWKRSPPEEITADAITFLGLVVAFWARIVLGGNWSLGIAFKAHHELIERGPYRWVRHPMYSGFLLLVFGPRDIVGRGGGFGILVVVFFSFLIRSRQEEKLLTKHFPVDYPEYKRPTKAAVIRSWSENKERSSAYLERPTRGEGHRLPIRAG